LTKEEEKVPEEDVLSDEKKEEIAGWVRSVVERSGGQRGIWEAEKEQRAGERWKKKALKEERKREKHLRKARKSGERGEPEEERRKVEEERRKLGGEGGQRSLKSGREKGD